MEETALAWRCPNGSCRVAFDDIAAIELEADLGADEPFARCDVVFANGERLRLEITYDAAHAKEIETFRAFIVRFFAVLGPARRVRIIFSEGAGPIKRMMALNHFRAAGVIAFVGIIIWLAVSGEYQEDNQFLLFPLAFLFVIMLGAMFVVSLKSGRKPFDPMDIPPHALPARPRKPRRANQA